LIGLCADLGGKVIVFGAAQNRRRSNLEYEKALSLAARFFHKTASVASDKGVTVCLEPLSIEYGCDFINTAEEAYDLVSLVHHNNFGLLLDTGVMALNNESAPDVIERYRDKIVHIHVNDPFLWSPGSAGIDHRLIGKALSELHYTGWISIEYENSTSSLEEVLGYVKNCYGMSSIP
jgi:D-psicose/D-tagatose/L-ribulose 3-epimerase